MNRQQAEAAAAAVRNLFPNLKCVHARTDGWGRCRIWAYCRLDSGVKQSAVARGKGAATALMNFIARINAQPECPHGSKTREPRGFRVLSYKHLFFALAEALRRSQI